jgi:thiol:disulfide interchange protein DsbA
MLTRALAVLAATFFALTAFAAPPEPFEGHEYARVRSPQPVATGNKVEVLEFFWYRCPHCFQLEPALEKWLTNLPKDAQLRRVPAVFRDDWMPGAKIFYSLEQLKLLDRLHGKVFNAYHVENLNLNTPAVLDAWIAKQGVDRKQFESVYNSFSIQSKAMQGARLAGAYGINGVPTFVIDGKYVTSMSMTGNEGRLFEVLDQLIAKARAERGSGKAASR